MTDRMIEVLNEVGLVKENVRYEKWWWLKFTQNTIKYYI